MEDVLCPDLINGFRSGSGPLLTRLEMRLDLQSNKSARAVIRGKMAAEAGSGLDVVLKESELES